MSCAPNIKSLTVLPSASQSCSAVSDHHGGPKPSITPGALVISVGDSDLLPSPRSLFRVSTKFVHGRSLLLCLCEGPQRTNFPASSSLCLKQWPASLSLLQATLSDILGKFSTIQLFIGNKLYQLMFNAARSIRVIERRMAITIHPE